jgi:hypothetical protein
MWWPRFFNIKDFLQAQMSTWIFRAKKLPIDNWHYDLCSLSPGNNPLLIRTSDVNKNSSPILYGLVLAYECFYNSFAATGNNYLFSYIFDNDVFRDTVSGNKIKKGFFSENFYNNNSFAIRSLKFNDCFLQAILKILNFLGNQVLILHWQFGSGSGAQYYRRKTG